MKTQAQLGSDFLAWLYFGIRLALIEEDDETIVTLGKSVQLRTVTSNPLDVNVKTDNLGANVEVVQAIRSGALFKSLSLCVSQGHRVYGFTLDENLVFSSLKLPDVFTDPNEDAAPELLDGDKPKTKRAKLPTEDVIGLRLMLVDEVERLIDRLFAIFVRDVEAGHGSELATRVRAETTRAISATLP